MNIGLLIKQSGFSKSCDGTDSYVGDYEDFERLTKAIRAEARAEHEKQEPVAWHEPNAYGNVTTHKKWAEENGWLPLYTKE